MGKITQEEIKKIIETAYRLDLPETAKAWESQLLEKLPYDRKRIVLELRLAGAIAAEEGKSIETCPYRYADADQWRNGFNGLWGTVEDCQDRLNEYRRRNKYE